jgi:uncharacterized membrane protein
MTAPIPPVFGNDWKPWAKQVRAFLQRGLSSLSRKDSDSRATEDGLLLWDPVNGYPVVSKGGVWRQIILEDGDAQLYIDTSVTAAAVNTAYPLTYTVGSANGISLGSPASRIVFDEGGVYLLSFSAQIASTSASTVVFYFWPRLNGTDVPDTTMQNTLHQNNSTLVVSRAAVLTVADGDYLEAMWAVDSTSGTLQASAATAFAPAAPASTLAITRLSG